MMPQKSASGLDARPSALYVASVDKLMNVRLHSLNNNRIAAAAMPEPRA
jgi:hypothetical protein